MKPATSSSPMAPVESQDLSIREIKSARSQDAIVEGVIRCLIKYGYSETTTSRIVAEAGVSRGALTHHFPVKEDAIVAATNKILAPTIGELKPLKIKEEKVGADHDTAIVKAELKRLWRGLCSTPHSLALIEILVAVRTDQALAARLQGCFEDWHVALNDWVARNYEHRNGDDADLLKLWGLVRVTFHGLMVHRPFAPDEGEIEKMADRLFDLVAPLIRRRTDRTNQAAIVAKD